MVQTKNARIFLACLQQSYNRLLPLISPYQVTFVKTLADAKSELKANRFNLIIIGTHFDDSKVFDLLRYVKENVNCTGVPVICFRGVKFGHAEDKSLVRIIEMACKEMGADWFFDLVGFENKRAEEDALRKVLNRLFPIERDPTAPG
jgi:hypothetical protein